MKDDKKKQKKADDGSVVDNPLSINTGYIPLDIAYGASTKDVIGITTLKNGYLEFANPTIDIATHGAIYKDTQLAPLVTLGTSALGENLLEMKINTIGDVRNFLVGVNNVASLFSENNGLLKSLESVSTIASNHGRLVTEAFGRVNIPSITNDLELATGYYSRANEVIKLSESVTTVLAYGQAVQNQFNSVLAGNELFNNGATILRDSAIAFGKISDHIPTYIGSETITSPFVYAPQRVKTKEVEKALPEVKKELPEKTTEAIELMEYVFDPTTKNDDKRITTTVSELKRAIKNMQGSVVMFMQQTTQKVEITALPKVQVSIEKNTSSTSKFPFKIPSGTTWQNITIQFTNSDVVNIQVGGHSHQTGYADMGFIDKRTNKPTTQWALLLVLAKNGGLLSASSADARDKYKKHKQLLSDKLKDYFDLEPDPFEPYKGGYKTKITLAPPRAYQSEAEDTHSPTDEVEDIFRDLTGE